MNFGAIVKSVGGALVPGKSSAQRAVASGLSGRLKAFDTAKMMEDLFTNYYGINLRDIPMMSPEELGELADKAEEAKFFVQNLPKIERHILNYIDGVTEYHEFVARCVKSGAAGMKKIDKSTLDVFLQLQGYQANQKNLAKTSDVEVTKINQEVNDHATLAEYDLNISLQIMAARLNRKQKELEAKPGDIAAREIEQARVSAERKYINDLISYGTKKAIAPSSTSTTGNGKGFVTSVRDFFAGK